MSDIRPLSELYEEIAERWVDYDAAANLKEDCKSAFLSERMLQYPDLAVNKAEMMVKGSQEWKTYIEETVEARRLANLYKVKLDVIRMRHSEWIAQDANQRMASKL